MSDYQKNEGQGQGQSGVSRKVAIGMAFGTVVLRERKLRRNVLFGLTLLTLLTLLLVFGGAVILGDGLMKSPVAFLIFWGICFLLVGLVLMLALYDLAMVRKDHKRRLKELESQLAQAAADARKQAAEENDEMGEMEKMTKCPSTQARKNDEARSSKGPASPDH